MNDKGSQKTNNDIEKALMPNGGEVRLKVMPAEEVVVVKAHDPPPPPPLIIQSSRSNCDQARKKGKERGMKSVVNHWTLRCLRCLCDSNSRSPEDLYQTYYNSEKQNDIDFFFVAALIFNVYALIVFFIANQLIRTWDLNSWAAFGALIASCMVNLLIIFGLTLHKMSKVPPRLWIALSLFGCFIFLVPIAVNISSYSPLNFNDSVIWVFLLIYVIYVLLPLRLVNCLLICLLTSCIHVGLTAYCLHKEIRIRYQVGANTLGFVAANILGIMSHRIIDTKHKKSFRETESHLKTKLQYEEHSQEQERLLLSVLPEHVANEIRKNLDEVAEDGQFKKIYMTRHENVSILFADIVGFTAISSTYSASDLVKILNELFARFDKLAEKFHQLRIKILGDCYYCISGAPEQRNDHAVLCVHMGLSMVEAIKYAREKTKSPVDMRVGIHTGAILAGIMGQRQWQFDVYSKDVVLANKMESGGRPGRVHISEKTLSFLNGEFEVEPGDGSSREEAIKSAGLKTYFIVKVLKPYPNGTLDSNAENTLDELEEQETALDECNSKEDSSMLPQSKTNSEDEYKRRLVEELIDRGKQRRLYDICSPVTLCFKDKNIESEYNNQKEDRVGGATMSVLVVAVFGLTAELFVFPVTVFNFLNIATGVFFAALLTCIPYFATSPVFKQHRNSCIWLFKPGEYVNGNYVWRHMWAFLLITILVLPNIVNMTFCEDKLSNSVIVNKTEMSEDQFTNYCIFPQYFTFYIVLALLSVTVLLQVSHLFKFVLMAFVSVSQTCMNVMWLDPFFATSDSKIYHYGSEYNPSMIPRKYTVTGMMIGIVLALIIINRHLEIASRLLFRWKREASDQKEAVAKLRLKNEKLIFNILPHHVAEEFLGRNKRDEEMYSKSYAEVGVLFASMPNFSDFYTEESVNNQGLECLRFLNEVISDFDALLEEPRFKDIIKIKTIGSTYMAASGINNEQEFPPDTPIKVRWAHLDQLTEFALALKDTLQNINEQSFNNFILKMGINHGPIIAGVIGVRKPHYDMWGNTVNVASRMESTGKASCIQVVEETSKILMEFGYDCELRGTVPVKGKGQLTTFYVTGKKVS